MDFLFDANDYLPFCMGATFLLALGMLWAGDNWEYWDAQADQYADRPAYAFSYARAERLTTVWCRISMSFLFSAVAVVGWGFYLSATAPPVQLYY